MKVYGGWTFDHRSRHRGQLAAVIAAPSVAAVMRATDQTRDHINSYWSTTGNDEDIAQAMTQPGVLFVRPLDSRDPADWEALP